MPSEQQIEALARVLARNGCDPAHASELARFGLLEVEKVEPVRFRRTMDMFDDINNWPPDYIELFWKAYPHKRTKAAMITALEKVKEAHIPWNTLMGALQKYITYVDSRPDLNWMHPATWLNGMSWEDEFAPVKENGRTTNGFAAIARHEV